MIIALLGLEHKRRGHAALEDTEKCLLRTLEPRLALERQCDPPLIKSPCFEAPFRFLGVLNHGVTKHIEPVKLYVPVEPFTRTLAMLFFDTLHKIKKVFQMLSAYRSAESLTAFGRNIQPLSKEIKQKEAFITMLRIIEPFCPKWK